MVYADNGINWFFPYEVEFEDDEILILKELPRQHKSFSTMKVDKWIDIHGNGGTATVDNQLKLLEIVRWSQPA